MNKPLLSICIATYNRADYIGATLDSIIPQLEDDMELLVVDGASPDNTEAVVKGYADPRIRYVRLPVKGGVDRDYCKAVELAQGEYCWLFTDDDLFRPGAIAAVKAALNEGHGLVVVNAEVRDRTLNVVLERQRLVMSDNRIYAPNEMDRLFADALGYLSFIGAVVIRRSIWLSRDHDPYIGTEFVHVGVIFQRSLAETALVIAEPFISIRFGIAHWMLRGFNIWMFTWPKLVWSFDHISDNAKLKVSSRDPWRNLMTLLIWRSYGTYTLQSYHQFISTAQAGVLWKSCAFLIARCPRVIIFSFHYLCSRLKGPESRSFFDAYVKW
ncbi:MAG: glycosyltransferase family 2 protein [Nitrospirota bacterium]